MKSRNPGCIRQLKMGLPVYYDGLKLDLGYRIDLLVEDLIVV